MSEKIYRVYTHTTPDGLKYVGVTTMKLQKRWQPSAYKGKSLYQYIEKFGWDNIKHEVIYTCTNRKEAYTVEDETIMLYREKGCCINKQRSGLIEVSDEKAYRKAWENEHAEERKAYKKAYRDEHREEQKAYRDEHREDQKAYMKAYNKALYSTPEGKVYSRVKGYNRYHPDNITITALEARYNYTTYSIVPYFIKHSDIPNAILYDPSVSTDQLPLF